MVTRTELDSYLLQQMFQSGADYLATNEHVVDALNVFPVPDGDTGTNMNLSIAAGVKEVEKTAPKNIAEVSEAFSKGLLMGARGNSGVILSQLFRGFATGLTGLETVTARQFANALTEGVKTAYKAVMKPVEGTILTVAKDAAKGAVQAAEKDTNFVYVMEETIDHAKKSLQNTPNLLPILKEANVVDAGGQGLVYIYEGFLSALTGEHIQKKKPTPPSTVARSNDRVSSTHAVMKTEDISFGFCTEVMVRFEEDKVATHPFDEEQFKQQLSEMGDSLLVIADDNLLKVHVHVEQPGEVLTMAQQYGELITVKIENMREQHTNLLAETKEAFANEQHKEKSNFGIIAVSMGKGMEKVFKGLGVNIVVTGGQTMNPSTEDFVKAITDVHAKNVLILPNNSNIMLAAKQAANVGNVNVAVVETTTIPQGIASLLAFNENESLSDNKKRMEEVIQYVKSGQVTFAVRDTTMNGIDITKGDFIGISESEIITAGKDKVIVMKQLLSAMVDEESEMITLLQGEDATATETKEILTFLETSYPHVEIDVHEGNQPLYSYIVSVE